MNFKQKDLEHLEYNTQRKDLIIPEYGRHIQKMVNQAVKIKSPEERNNMARAIIGVMGNLNPHLRDVPDFQHKLWDQLLIISDFQLNVDSPFPKITKEFLEERPTPLSYPKINFKYRYYGKNILKIIDVASKWEDSSSKDILYRCIANYMKKSYLNWNKDTVEDHVIFHHLRELSDGKIDIKPDQIQLIDSDKLINVKTIFKRSNSQKNKKRKPQKRN